MKFSALTALCAAPLALASTLQADLVARGAIGGGGGAVASQGSSSSSGTKGKASNNMDSNSYSGSSTSVSITEVIVLWVNNGGNSATSTVNSPMSSSANVAAATHTVIVGGSGGLVYTPNTIEAAVGDMVIFTFMSNNHTATQSAFTTPCEKLTGGMDSGFMPNINNTVSPAPQMAMQVAVTTPIWFYCRQSGHCGKGMTFSVNPTANKTQAMFEQMAIAQNGTGTAGAITGGSSSAGSVAGTTIATAAAASATSVSSGSSNAGSLASGTGTTSSGGSCTCSCFCGVAAFPAAVQGLGGFGGMSGAMPMLALEV